MQSEGMFVPVDMENCSWLPAEHWFADPAGIQYGKREADIVRVVKFVIKSVRAGLHR